MFGFGKKKKENENNIEKQEQTVDENLSEKEIDSKNDNIMMGLNENQVPEKELTERDKEKIQKIDSVKQKISKILKSSNVEIIDENLGDDYGNDAEGGSDAQKQQDYDSLKALFGDNDKKKKKELTLTVDEFDYTNVGQNIEEFDLVHLKGIKKIRIQSKYIKLYRRLLIIVPIVAVLAVGIVFAFKFTKKKPVVLSSVVLNETSAIYYDGQNFSYKGLYLTAKYSDGKTEKIILNSSYLYDAFGGYKQDVNGNISFSAEGGLTGAGLVFSYSGFKVDFEVEIKSKEITGIKAVYDDEIFERSPGEVIDKDFLKIFAVYNGPYTDELIDLSKVSLTIGGVNVSYDSTSAGFVVPNEFGASKTISASYSGKIVTLLSGQLTATSN